jgi:hypothetical protein
MGASEARAQYQGEDSQDQPDSKFQNQDSEMDDGSQDDKSDEGSTKFKPDADDTYEDDQSEKSDQVDSKFKEDQDDDDTETNTGDN